jgi:uncharacterized protein
MMTAILGGVLVGTAAGLLFLLEGRIAGVSGLVARSLDPTESDRTWRILFVVALVAGAALVEAIVPGTLPHSYDASTARLVSAGLLVGIGARLGNGCTSGHGLCGVARGSTRSLAALATFMVLGMLTVFVGHAVAGGLR